MILGDQFLKFLVMAAVFASANVVHGQSQEAASSRRVRPAKRAESTKFGIQQAVSHQQSEPIEVSTPPKFDEKSARRSSRRIPATRANIGKTGFSVLSDTKESRVTTATRIVPQVDVEIDSEPPVSNLDDQAKLNSVLSPLTPPPERQDNDLAKQEPPPADQVSSKSSGDADDKLTSPTTTRIAKRLEPIPPRKPLPRLLNPEQFLVTEPTPKKFEFSEVILPPLKPMPRIAKQEASVDAMQESWLDSLPTPTLDGKLRSNSLQRAASNRRVDPFVEFAKTAVLGIDYRMDSQAWVKTWRTPNMSHRPIYFEDENLERYGIGYGRWQPLVSGTKFFTEAIFLPYRVGAQHPGQCVYEMGYYRPGDCVPAFRREFELSRRGFFNQAMGFGLVFGGL